MCPVCTVTVIAGLGISRLIGIDDTITSMWIGGLILSVSFWLLGWLHKKRWLAKINDKKTKSAVETLIIVLMYLLVLIPLKLNHSIGIPGNTLWGIDKIILGTSVGSIFFLLSLWADKRERKVRGKQLFKFQKVIFPVSTLLIISILFWIITI
jgi:hypothetical protein